MANLHAVCINDTELVRRLKHKDADVLSDIFDLYGARLIETIDRVVYDLALAEDLAQECFRRLWNRSGQMKAEPGSLSVWISMIGWEVALDHVQSREPQCSFIQRRVDGGKRPVNECLTVVLDCIASMSVDLDNLPADQRELVKQAIHRGSADSEVALNGALLLKLVKGVTHLSLRRLVGMVKSAPWVEYENSPSHRSAAKA